MAEDVLATEEAVATIEPGGRPYYWRVTIAGLLLMAATMVVIAVVQLGSGDTSGLAFFIIVVSVVLVGAGLVWKSGSWAMILGAVVGLLGVVLVFGPFLAIAIVNINSFFDFSGAIVATVGSIVALVGGIVAFIQSRQESPRNVATVAERNTFRGIGAVIAVLVVVSGVVTLAGRESVGDAERVGATEIVMKKTEFETTELEAKAGEEVRLVLKNNDLFMHNFIIEELAIDVTIGPRSEKLLKFKPASAGTFKYICDIPGHESMEGELTVN